MYGTSYLPNYSMAYPSRMEVVHVNGRPGAETYQMPPNSNALVLDDTSPIVWLLQTDGAGYKTCTPYSITPYKPEATLEERIKRLEDVIYAKSDSTSTSTHDRQQHERQTGYDPERSGKRSERSLPNNASE